VLQVNILRCCPQVACVRFIMTCLCPSSHYLLQRTGGVAWRRDGSLYHWSMAVGLRRCVHTALTSLSVWKCVCSLSGIYFVSVQCDNAICDVHCDHYVCDFICVFCTRHEYILMDFWTLSPNCWWPDWVCVAPAFCVGCPTLECQPDDHLSWHNTHCLSHSFHSDAELVP